MKGKFASGKLNLKKYGQIWKFEGSGDSCNFRPRISGTVQKYTIIEILPFENAQWWWCLRVLQRLAHVILINRNFFDFKTCIVFLPFWFVVSVSASVFFSCSVSFSLPASTSVLLTISSIHYDWFFKLGPRNRVNASVNNKGWTTCVSILELVWWVSNMNK